MDARCASCLSVMIVYQGIICAKEWQPVLGWRYRGRKKVEVQVRPSRFKYQQSKIMFCLCESEWMNDWTNKNMVGCVQIENMWSCFFLCCSNAFAGWNMYTVIWNMEYGVIQTPCWYQPVHITSPTTSRPQSSVNLGGPQWRARLFLSYPVLCLGSSCALTFATLSDRREPWVYASDSSSYSSSDTSIERFEVICTSIRRVHLHSLPIRRPLFQLLWNVVDWLEPTTNSRKSG